MTDLRIYWDPAQTKYFVPDQTTIPARTIIEVGLPPEKVKAELPMDYSLHLKANAYDPVLATRVSSNFWVARTTSLGEQAIIKFMNTKGVPYYPATAVLINKKTGEYWQYEGDSDGVFRIPKRYYKAEETGDYCLYCHYHEPGSRIAVAVLDDYDFGNYEVRKNLEDRVMAETVIHVKPSEGVLQQIVGLMPGPLKKAAEVLAGFFGWASEQVGRLVGIFLNAFLIKVTGGEIVRTNVDVGKGTIRIVRVMRTHAVPAFVAILIKIIKWSIAFIAVWKITETLIAYSPAKVRQLRKEELAELSKTLDELGEAYEKGALTKEEYSESVKALTHSHSTSNGAAPPHPAIEFLQKLGPVILIGGGVVAGLIILTRVLR